MPSQAVTALGMPYIRENYTKFEYRIPMRDGVKLFTSVYVPKDVFTDGKHLPDHAAAHGYSVGPTASTSIAPPSDPPTLFAREKFIFVYQDVRGRYLSEGEYVVIRPHKPVKNGAQGHRREHRHLRHHRLAGQATSRAIPAKSACTASRSPAFYATAGMIDAHPALVAVAPQAPVTDYYMGDDSYHNGAFMLAHRFNFYHGLPRRAKAIPQPPQPALPFQFGTPDGYDFYLAHGLAGQRR